MAEFLHSAKATEAVTVNAPPVDAEAMYIPTKRAYSGAGIVKAEDAYRLSEMSVG